MALLSILALICLVTVVGGLAWWAIQDRQLNCTNNGCTQDCNQGRSCVCAPSLETQRRHQLEDEFNNANWPFPVNRP
jgi:hypothetical protein